MIGNAAKVRRCASIFAVEGSSGCTREIAAFTYCSVWNMSMSQRKYKSISADPRLVMDLTVCSPGTLLTASSIGRVTVTVIWSMGITPLSTAISTRGKSVLGKTDTGIVKARYAPSRPNVRIRKMTGRECCAIQYWLVECSSVERTTFSALTQMLRGVYLSLDPSPGAFDPSLEPSAAPSAGA